jgi:hypothetical protein
LNHEILNANLRGPGIYLVLGPIVSH